MPAFAGGAWDFMRWHFMVEGIMRGKLTRVYVHLVWGTWNRRRLLEAGLREQVYRAILAEATKLGCVVGAIGGVEDHLHVLVRMNTSVSIADLVKQMKGASSHLVRQRLTPGRFFKWQGGYGAFSVGPRGLRRVCAYIHRQEEHHRAGRLLRALERTDLH
jgi:putative transposase